MIGNIGVMGVVRTRGWLGGEGLGDVKFMAAIGAFIGWQGALFSLMVSSLIGAAVGVTLILLRKREWSSRMPYGPYIALAAVIWLFGGKKLFHAIFAM